MEGIKNYILRQVADRNLGTTEAKKLLEELKSSVVNRQNDIAVIGMSCRFPHADNVDMYWLNLKNGMDCIREFPKERAEDIKHLYQMNTINKIEYHKGGYLTDIDKFDYKFFHMSPREAKFIDPLQRIFLENTWSALEDAGYGGKKSRGTKTGVFVGNDFTNISMYKYITEPDQMHLTGSWSGLLATRIMYILDLKGPGMIIDTACSSGITAVHQACEALNNNGCNMALAGGVCLGLVPAPKDADDSMKMLESTDYKVRTFDKNANGTVWGEGVAVVVLKKLCHALEDRDNILAVIKGSAINNDGKSNGITSPNAQAQEEVILQAWKNANINPESITYVETHGTGTALGDPIEIKALTRAFRKFTNKIQFCGIGSVKTNLGHLVGASGMASLIKVILSLNNRSIPATLNFNEVSPYINFIDSPLYVNDCYSKWEASDRPRNAGISSFGFSGTNCHIVLEEAPREEVKILAKEKLHLFVLSALNEDCLKILVKKYIVYLQNNPNSSLEEICYTLATGRGHYNCRIGFKVKDLEELEKKLLVIDQNSELKAFPDKDICYKKHVIVKKEVKQTEIEINEESMRSINSRASELVEEIITNNDEEIKLKNLLDFYIMGADIEWELLYQNQKTKKMRLPSYPFSKYRCWAEPRISPSMLVGNSKANEHVLLGEKRITTIGLTIYVNHLSNQQWEMKEHKISGRNVFPGTAYVELMYEAGRVHYQQNRLELFNIIFYEPLIIEPGMMKEIHTIVKNNGDALEVSIASRIEDAYEETFVRHAVCTVFYNNQNQIPDNFNIRKTQLRCKNEVREFRLPRETGIMELGDRWFALKRGWFLEDEILAEIELPNMFKEDSGKYSFHPALLDCSSFLAFINLQDHVYLPYSYHSFRVLDIMPDYFYSYLQRKKNSGNSSETIEYDIKLIDSDGRIFAEIDNYILKKVPKYEIDDTYSGKKNNYYKMVWIPSSVVLRKAKQGTVLLFANAQTISSHLEEELIKCSFEVIVVLFSQEYKRVNDNHYLITGVKSDYARLFDELAERDLNYIIHLSSVTDTILGNSIDELNKLQEMGVFSVLRITKSLIRKGYNSRIQILLIADYAGEVTSFEKTIKPHNMAMFGLGSVLQEEHGNMEFKCIDIDDSVVVSNLLNELNFDEKEKMVSYRDKVRYIQEFQQINKAELTYCPVEIKENGVYIIAGGTGGIGTEISKYIVSKGQVNLLIIGRDDLSANSLLKNIGESDTNSKKENKRNNLNILSENGAKVKYYNGDISNLESMIKIINDIRTEYGKINGIVHCAGTAGDKFAFWQSEEEFKEVTTAKIEGTFILDNLTLGDNLDFFILCSSAATIYGMAGQGNYTAASWYMDSYANLGSKQGKRIISVDWPAWREVGMAAEYGVNNINSVFQTISISEGLHIFEEMLKYQFVRAIPVSLNYEILAQFEEKIPFELSGTIKNKLHAYRNKSTVDIVNQVKTIKKEKAMIIEKENKSCNEIEKDLAKIWNRVLELDQLDVHADFHELGGDSILATQLLKELELFYPGYINISDIFTYSSVSELAGYIFLKIHQNEAKIDKTKEELSDDALRELLNDLEKGETTAETGLKILLGKGYET